MTLDRRSLLLAAACLPALASTARAASQGRFQEGFLWGAATSGHQTEGGNVASDSWAVENLPGTSFTEPSGDACDSYHRWAEDMDIVSQLGLNTYRFSLEWSRIEPEPGQISRAALDHYKALIAGCRARGLTPVVTFNHFTCPRWFAEQGGWTNPQSPELFAAYCLTAARHLAAGIGYAVTLNEPNLMRLLRRKLPPQVFAGNDALMALAAQRYGSKVFVSMFIENAAQTEAMNPILLEAHRKARAAIKSVRPDLPVGVSLAIEDDQATGDATLRDDKRSYVYDAWLKAAREDDFLGVQNYERSQFGPNGVIQASSPGPRNQIGGEIYPASLAGAVRYAHSISRVPILVSEHGVAAEDDALRAAFIPAALTELKAAMDGGIPVLGYIHWSLLDNFEWVFGYRPKFGLVAVDRKTFARTPKPSARVLGAIARANHL